MDIHQRLASLEARVSALEGKDNTVNHASFPEMNITTTNLTEITLIPDPNITREISMRHVMQDIQTFLPELHITKRNPADAKNVRSAARIYVLFGMERWQTQVDVPSFVPLVNEQDQIPFFLMILHVGNISQPSSGFGNQEIPTVKNKIADVQGNVRSGVYIINTNDNKNKENFSMLNNTIKSIIY